MTRPLASALLGLAILIGAPAAAQTPATSVPQANTVQGPAWPASAPTPEQVMYDQPRLMRSALARVKPQDPHRTDLYLIAFAGDGGENVFRNEAEYAARLFAQRYHAAGHTLVLENNPATLATAPLATWTNLETALAALHRIMDPRQDILVLYLTSHGSPDHYLAVDMNPLPLDAIGAKDLAGILREESFRWKVVIVNACYSGGFVPPLRGPDTLVISAARSDRSSFGCGAESKITYFGDAFLTRGLNHKNGFAAAFRQARRDVTVWESLDGYAHSDPQIAEGKAIAAKLATWRTHDDPGPPVPFRAATMHPSAGRAHTAAAGAH